MMTKSELVKYKLSTLANAENEQIETGGIELYWEDQEGNEFVTEESVTSIAQSALDLLTEMEVVQEPPNPAVAAIEFALNNQEGMAFLRCWNAGEFDAIRDEWPEAPEDVFIGADPMHTKSTKNA